MTFDQVSTRDEPVVCIVDDEGPVRASLVDLFESVAMKAIAFESASDFLERCDMGQAGCILLDVRMPGITGLDLQTRLVERASRLPIIFATSYADEDAQRKALDKGAVAFLYKPFVDETLFAAIRVALSQ